MPIFSEIDIAAFLESPAASVNGVTPSGTPVSGPQGLVPGLSESLIALLRNFSPGDVGVGAVDEAVRVTLPMSDWASWAWLEAYLTSSATAGTTSEVILFTVPEDERAYLHHVNAERNNGDNTVARLEILYPSGYYLDDAKLMLTQPVPATANVFWPDPGGVQTVRTVVGPGPLLLEAGAKIQIGPQGAGVSTTRWNVDVALTRTRLVRSIAP